MSQVVKALYTIRSSHHRHHNHHHKHLLVYTIRLLAIKIVIALYVFKKLAIKDGGNHDSRTGSHLLTLSIHEAYRIDGRRPETCLVMLIK